ncbi:MAG: TIGR04211 family SH3 domain-containing protein [Pseudomonadota bacterium]
MFGFRWLPAIAGLCVFLISAATLAETRYVTDDFEVMMRRGPTLQNAITRVLTSGTAVEELERDEETGYSRVRTSGGTEGYVLTRFLMSEPAAREQLATLRARVESLRGQSGDQGRQLDDLKQQDTANRQQIQRLEAENGELQRELAEIRRVSAETLRINSENTRLRESLSEADISLATLEQENDRLARRREQNWFLIGAAVLALGIILGIVAPRLSGSRRNRYGSSL